LGIKTRAMLLHRPRCSIVLFYEYADGIVLLEFCKLFFCHISSKMYKSIEKAKVANPPLQNTGPKI